MKIKKIAVVSLPDSDDIIIVFENPEFDLTSTVQENWPGLSFYIKEYDKHGDVENRQLAKSKPSKNIQDEYLVHKFASSILGYVPENNIQTYKTKVSEQYVNLFSRVSYRYTVYNATTKKVVAKVYDVGVGDNALVVKVSGKNVTEYYKQNVMYNGANRAAVSYDVDTHSPLEYYETLGNMEVKKYSLNGELLATSSLRKRFPDVVEMPPHLKKIVSWSKKDNGDVIIDYVEDNS